MNQTVSKTLVCHNLCARLKVGREVVTVVDGLSFSLERGKTLALVGESGCGKSMAALSLLRILPTPPALPPEGELIFKGKNLFALPEREMRSIRGGQIAMIFQDPMSALNPVYRVGDQILEAVQLHLALEDPQKRVMDILREVGLPERVAREYPHQLSGGMKQRVMIAMALVCEPDILIADEPTTALDVTIQAQILELMRDLQRRKGTSILFITHDMGVVAEMADEVVVMYATEAVERAPVETLFDQMAHPYTQGLFAARPRGKGKLATIPGSVPPVTHLPAGCRFHPRCPHVMPCCREGRVPFVEIDENHEARCWLSLKSKS